jgi:NAD(P)-dependent dehydrogenase (short-subunit alcohol dehydrogenase family)
VTQISYDFSGKVFAVSGAAGALGAAVVASLAAAKATIAAIDRSATAKSEAAVHVTGVDASDAQAAQGAIERIVAKAGRLDGLVNLAGGFTFDKVEEGSPATWDGMFAQNLKTTLNLSKAALPHLIAGKAGRIVNIGAAGAAKASAGMGAYAASKAAVARLTEALADELKDKGVTVNAVLPSIIDTARNRADMPKADPSRWVPPAAVAALISFLLSESAASITGALIPITGRV